MLYQRLEYIQQHVRWELLSLLPFPVRDQGKNKLSTLSEVSPSELYVHLCIRHIGKWIL